MFEEIKLQIQLTFELELLKNHKLQLINWELEDDGDYIGREIVHSSHPYTSQIDVSDLEDIASDAIEDLLKRGVCQTIYEVTESDGAGNSYCYYPTIYCTNLCAVCDAVKYFCEALSDIAYDNDDFIVHEYLRQHLSVYAYTFEGGNVIATQLF